MCKGTQKDVEKEVDNKLALDNERELNQIDMIPKEIKVKAAQHWKTKDMSQVKDFKEIEIISDWTFSTTYKGNVRYLSKHIDRISKETSLKLESKKDKTK